MEIKPKSIKRFLHTGQANRQWLAIATRESKDKKIKGVGTTRHSDIAEERKKEFTIENMQGSCN